MMTLIQDYGADLLRAIGLHTIYVLISVVIGFAAGLVFGILLSRIPRWLSGIIIPILSIFQTIPGLVFIGVLFIWWGNIYPTVIVALSVYAMFPVLKNTYTGLLGVEQKYLEAAKGCGMSQLQSLLRVELPLAMPSIIAGLRMSAIYTVSWAVLAAMIGLGGLGGFVYQGTSSNNNTLILLGAIPSALLAIVIGALVDLFLLRQRFAIIRRSVPEVLVREHVRLPRNFHGVVVVRPVRVVLVRRIALRVVLIAVLIGKIVVFRHKVRGIVAFLHCFSPFAP